MKPAINVKEVDPRLTAVADWLRNEKKSGLHTKEAVQYEKVRARRPALETLRPPKPAPPAPSPHRAPFPPAPLAPASLTAACVRAVLLCCHRG